jgi:hypothetical protein
MARRLEDILLQGSEARAGSMAPSGRQQVGQCSADTAAWLAVLDIGERDWSREESLRRARVEHRRTCAQGPPPRRAPLSGGQSMKPDIRYARNGEVALAFQSGPCDLLGNTVPGQHEGNLRWAA